MHLFLSAPRAIFINQSNHWRFVYCWKEKSDRGFCLDKKKTLGLEIATVVEAQLETWAQKVVRSSAFFRGKKKVVVQHEKKDLSLA